MSRRVPGLVDIHVHGYQGLDVMAGQGNALVQELRKLGIEWCCPTTVTASNDEVQTALDAIDPNAEGFAGIHLEGPFISPQRAGAQAADSMQAPSIAAYENTVGKFADMIRVVTLAPEVSGAAELAAYLHERGVLVSAGHTDAAFADFAGVHVDHMTHFYNAMRPLGHREPGSVGFGLTSPVKCELIYDRLHVSETAAEVLIRCKGEGGVIGVSDGTAASGMSDGWSGEMWGQAVHKQDGAIRLEDGTLAGSAVTLVDVFRNLWQDFGPDVAVSACSTAPREALRLPEPKLWLDVDDTGTIIEVLSSV